MLPTTPTLLIVSVIVAGQAMAQSGLPATQSERLLRKAILTTLPLQTATDHIYSINPATQTYKDSISLSAISVTGGYAHSQKAIMEQLGTGENGISVAAESYQHLSPYSTVWGAADFTTGKTRDVKWSNCIDYLRVAPYVLGDEVGGDLSRRRYAFAGGYSGLLGRWTVGIGADYRAEIAYRARDPRVKTVVSDLNVKVGASYRLTPEYALGLNGGINVYHQNCDLEFYNPINDINTFALTGLGTYYQRFMGNINKSSGYQSVGFNVALQFVSTMRQGFMGSLEFDRYKMEQHLRNFNNLTLGFSEVSTVAAAVAYKFCFSRTVKFQPLTEYRFVSHAGSENLFGTSAGASYDQIGSRSVYRHNTWFVKLSLPVQMQNRETYCTIAPYAVLCSDGERYLEPIRELQVRHLTPGLSASLSTTRGSWLWSAMVDGSYATASAKTPVLTGLDADTSLARSVISNYDMLKADAVAFESGIRGGRVVSEMLIDVTIKYKYQRYCRESDCHSVSLSLCARF